MAGVRVTKSLPKSVPPAPRAKFVFGSYPDSVKAPDIKPGPASTTLYGKDNLTSKKGVAGAGFGTTGSI